MIDVSNLWKKFGTHDALRGLSFHVPEGSAFALIGANGAGKTTTIKVLMNIIEPTRGSVSVMGVDSKKLSPREFRRIGYVSENQDMPGKMTVAEYLAYLRHEGGPLRHLHQSQLPSGWSAARLFRHIPGTCSQWTAQHGKLELRKPQLRPLPCAVLRCPRRRKKLRNAVSRPDGAESLSRRRGGHCRCQTRYPQLPSGRSLYPANHRPGANPERLAGAIKPGLRAKFTNLSTAPLGFGYPIAW